MRDDAAIVVDDRALEDAVLVALAEAYAEAPPAALKARIVAMAAADVAAAGTRRALGRWRVVGSIAAGAVVALGALALRLHGSAGARGAELQALARDHAALTAKLDAQTRTLAALHESIEAGTGVLRVLARPKPLVATLEAKLDGTAAGRVVVDPTSGDAAVLLSGLDPTLESRVYELWTIRGAAPPEPAALVTVSADGTAWARIASLPQPSAVTAFAVSIEPVGGSPAPTGPIVLVGAVRAG